MISILIFCFVIYLLGFILALAVNLHMEIELEVYKEKPFWKRVKLGLGSWVNVIVWLTILDLYHRGALKGKAIKR